MPLGTPSTQEADYFFVPVYTSCLIFPTYQWADGPLYYGPRESAVGSGGVLDALLPESARSLDPA